MSLHREVTNSISSVHVVRHQSIFEYIRYSLNNQVYFVSKTSFVYSVANHDRNSVKTFLCSRFHLRAHCEEADYIPCYCAVTRGNMMRTSFRVVKCQQPWTVLLCIY